MIMLLNVRARDGTVIRCQISDQSSLQKLIDGYCNRMLVSKDKLYFVFDKKTIQNQTPFELGMKDGDNIYVFYK